MPFKRCFDHTGSFSSLFSLFSRAWWYLKRTTMPPLWSSGKSVFAVHPVKTAQNIFGQFLINWLGSSYPKKFNQLLLMQPTTNAKWSLNRRDNNSLTTLEDADSTQFYWWLDKSGGKGSSLDFKTFRCSTPSSVGSHERKSRFELRVVWVLHL